MPENRCPWAKGELYCRYHDLEWGVPVHDDRKLFEMLILEGAQAGLSWETILKKREAYRTAFDNFEAARIAAYGDDKIAALLADTGIVRNRLKIHAAIGNARAFLELQARHGSFDKFIWSFVDGEPIRNRWSTLGEVPARTDQSDAVSEQLVKAGCKFAGSTICYAFMQAVGMVNDHLTSCYRWAELDR